MLGKGIQLFMDGKGSWRAQREIRRGVKTYESVSQTRQSIAAYLPGITNTEHPGSRLRISISALSFTKIHLC
jgi:hypothetical protein